MPHLTRFIAALFLLAPGATAVPAQQVPTGRIAVQVVIPESNGTSNDVVATRQPGRSTAYTITIPRSLATPAVLAAAAIDVVVLLHRDGDDWRDTQSFRVAGDTAAPPDEIRAAEWVLGNILASAPRAVSGVGRAHVGEMYLPNAASRRAAAAKGIVRIATKRETNRLR